MNTFCTPRKRPRPPAFFPIVTEISKGLMPVSGGRAIWHEMISDSRSVLATGHKQSTDRRPEVASLIGTQHAEDAEGAVWDVV